MKEILKPELIRLFDEVVKDVARDFGTLLQGKSVVLSNPDVREIDLHEIEEPFKSYSVVSRGEFVGDNDGALNLVLKLQDVLFMACCAAMMSGEETVEKLAKLEYTPDDADAYGMVVDQFYASTATCFRNFLSGDYSHKVVGTQRHADIAAAQDDFGGGRLIAVGYDMTIAGAEASRMLIVLEDGFAGALAEATAQIYNEEILARAEAEEDAVDGTPDPAGETESGDAMDEDDGTDEVDYQRLMQIEIPIIVSLAEKYERLENIVRYSQGSIIEFEKSHMEFLDLLVQNKMIAQGEAVKVGENFGLRIQHVVSPTERVRAMGK